MFDGQGPKSAQPPPVTDCNDAAPAGTVEAARAKKKRQRRVEAAEAARAEKKKTEKS